MKRHPHLAIRLMVIKATLLNLVAVAAVTVATAPEASAGPHCGVVGEVSGTIARDDWGFFTPGPFCFQHDICYSEGGQTKDACDEQFRRGMVSSCIQSASPAKCRVVAWIYYAAVRTPSAWLHWERYRCQQFEECTERSTWPRMWDPNILFDVRPWGPPGWTEWGLDEDLVLVESW